MKRNIYKVVNTITKEVLFNGKAFLGVEARKLLNDYFRDNNIVGQVRNDYTLEPCGQVEVNEPGGGKAI